MSEPARGIEGTGLSARGERRREEILGTLQRAMTARRRRRSGIRAAGAVGAIVLVVGAAAVLASRTVRTSGSGTHGPIATGTEGTAKADRSSGMITLVRDDPGILDRVVVPRVAAVAVIDDDELALLLDEAGRPSGLVRTGGRVYLAADIGSGKESVDRSVN